MSAAAHVMGSERGDSRRFMKAFVLAVLGHVILFLVFAIILLTESSSTLAPVSVELVPGTLGEPALAGPPVAAAQQAQAPARQSGGGAQGFVIPTPRQGPAAPSLPSGPAFRTAGPAGAQAPNAPQAASPVQEPVFPHAPSTQQGTSAFPSGGSGGSGGGPAASGPARGVLVQGGGQAPVKGSLNLQSLDSGFANAQGSGAAPAGESGGGGAGGTSSTAGGAGQGTGIHWDQPEAASDRKLLSAPKPEIPEWVSKQGFNLTVLVSFSLTADGFLRDVNIEASSGFPAVDAAVMEAVREWRFSRDPSAHPINGMITYHIKAQ